MKSLQTLTPFNKSDFEEMKGCLKPAIKNFRRKEVIMRLNDENSYVGIILSGSAQLTTTSFDGTKSIIDYFEKGAMFGKNISHCTDFDPYVVTAKTKCSICMVEYSRIIACCSECCERHIHLIDRMLYTTSRRAQMHIEVLGRRTIRGKLLSFFLHISQERGSRTFKLPLSLSDLADYIAVDRSAMMREIKKLNDEKIIVSKTTRITLLKDIAI